MPISFPSSPTLNQTYSVGNKTWVWNGYGWNILTANTSNIQTLAQAAFNQANSAASVANTDYTTLTITTTTSSSNGTFVPVIQVSSNGRILSVTNTSILASTADATQNLSIAAAFSQANVTVGVDATQNASITIIQGVNNTQNASITVIQGVDNTQNLSIQAAYNQANNALPNTGSSIVVNGASVFRIANTTTSTSNTTGSLIVGGGLGVAGNIYADAVYDGGIEILTFSQAAFNQANVTVGVDATQNLSIQSAFNQANSAATKANTDNTVIVATTSSSNGTFVPVVQVSANGRVLSVTNTAILASTADATQNLAIAYANTTVNAVALSAYSSANIANISYVTAGTYGNSNTIAVVTVAANGRILRITNTAITNTFSDLNTLSTLKVSGNTFIDSDRSIVNYGIKINALGTVSGNTTISLNVANFVTATIGGLTTFIFANPLSSVASGFILELANGGSNTVTWPSSVRWPSGSGPILTTSGTDVLVFITDDTGTNWRGVMSMKDSK